MTMANKCPKCKTDNPDTLKFCGECGTQLISPKDADVTETIEAPRKDLTTGSTFAGRYQIIEELGKGGMGKVYKAHDTEIKEKVALKLIKPEISSDKKTIERFQNELKLARKISHRNVCRMYDLNKEEGSYYITMEYVSGEDLKSFIRRAAPLSTSRAITIAEQVCDGLAEAHRLGVVHRDLKPSNIMIDKDGHARIMDFGIARSLKEKGITGAGVMIGTPEYMSPEQVEGKEADQRTDIYALGVILYEMVTGRVPFEGDTALTVAVKHKTEEPQDPKELNPQLSDGLSRLILKCLEKDKEKRYESAGDVRSELENIKEGFPTTETAVPERKPLTSREITVQLTPKKILVPALVIVAVIVIGFVIFKLLQKEEGITLDTDKPSLAVMYLENNTGDETLDNWRKALAELLTHDLSQSRHIRVLSADRLDDILKKENLEESKTYSAEEIRKVASQGRVQNVLVGSYNKAGDTFRINVELRDSNSWNLLGAEREECQGEDELFGAVDRLTKKIKTKFNLSTVQIAGDVDRDVSEITTSSPEALKHYLEGRRHHMNQDYKLGIEFFLKAVRADPEFAAAYRMLGVAYDNMGSRYYAERTKYMQKAFDLKEHASELEKYLIMGSYYNDFPGKYAECVDAYKKALEIDPDCGPANNNLAIKYGEAEDWENAIKHYEINRKNRVMRLLGYNNLASTYQAIGEYDKVQEIWEEFIGNAPNRAYLHRRLAYNYIYQGEYDKAMEELDKSDSLEPGRTTRSIIYYLQDDFKEAVEDLKNYYSRDKEGANYNYYRWMSIFSRAQGKFSEANDWANQGLKIAEKNENEGWQRTFKVLLILDYTLQKKFAEALDNINWYLENAIKNKRPGSEETALFFKINTLIAMNDLDAVDEYAERLRELNENHISPKRIRRYYSIKGMIALKRADYRGAIDYLEKAYALERKEYTYIMSNAIYPYYIGTAYFKRGNLNEAQASFEELIGMTTGRAWWGHLYPLSFYMLGKIFEQQNDEAKAIEHYEKFLELWKDADPGIDEVEDAKKKLADLKSGN
jgi:serine/threonine protein kinase/Flp pilus assembly protein TadD